MNIYIKSIGIFFVLMLTSCNEDFIELAPISEGNAENFYETPEDFENAVIAIYNNLQSEHQYGSSDTRFGGSFYALMEVRADDATDGEASAGSGREVFEVDTYVDNPLSGVIEGAWGSIFKTIFEANIVVTRIEQIEIDQSLKNQYLGEARFLRALAYFNAVRLWGNVPIIDREITPQEASTFSRNVVAEVYDFIVADFQFAATNLPATFSGQEGRATSGAARAFLGKVYVTQQRWAEAVTMLEQVIATGTYTLLPDVADVFELGNELNAEFVFTARFVAGDDGEGHLGFGTPEYANLLTLYEAGDTRLPLLTPVVGDNGTYPEKQFEAGSSQLGRDFPILRYADVLLLYAEALNEVGYVADGMAFSVLNQIRTRAGVPTFTAATLSNQEAFRMAVLEERHLELALELHRWFDLIRTGTAIEALNAAGTTVQPYQLLYPIPQSEINVYNNPARFPQNTGY